MFKLIWKYASISMQRQKKKIQKYHLPVDHIEFRILDLSCLAGVYRAYLSFHGVLSGQLAKFSFYFLPK